MRKLTAALFASAFLISIPVAMPVAVADDLTISPEVGVQFQSDVKVKKYKSYKYKGDVAVGVEVPGDVEYYDVPEDVIVARPALKKYKYVYLNDHVYLVEPSSRKVVVEVE